ncbi:cation diffusion facilitator family transporter [Ponticoccus alexandrii]|uniref:Cation diffusion facilitator family transporter n=1 Tax=Ponticoccus alexandrii TaxID=1943633 RepID=A0ABX7FBB8_9RHOB|nr:cation diffusion facilitator family transporter [Ponticoccus alexandrii]ETA49869.1 zinc transporter ZitB [Rhodobacteraceae bacterium PD-2]QRF67013.1 cation diffusion facilitator family transporter [Ponticoccus alexandrii]
MGHDHSHGHDHAHGHSHAHGHGHAGHSHGPTLSANDTPEARRSKERAILVAAALTGGFMGAEVIGGIISGSLALLADAGHMLTDFASLLLAWFAFRLARRPADWKRTYGFDRFSVLAAFVNGLTLFAIAGWIVFEAVQRLREPHEVLGGLMLWVAVGGLVVNVLAFWVLSRAEGDNLNVRAAALHVMGDLLGSVAAIAASLIIIWTGWTPIDPNLSVLVALLILRSAWSVVRESGHILLEGAPAGFDARAVATDLEATLPGVARAHHVHAWSITQERPMATLEIELAPGAVADDVRRAVKGRVRETTGMEHVTVEVTAGEERRTG